MYYVYILQLSNGEPYIGSTSNLRKRWEDHVSGSVVAIKPRRPFILVFYEAFQSQKDALRRERYFKTTKGKTALRLMLRDSLKQ